MEAVQAEAHKTRKSTGRERGMKRWRRQETTTASFLFADSDSTAPVLTWTSRVRVFSELRFLESARQYALGRIS